MAKHILYHGTAHDFQAFDDSSVGRGSDPNSTLGIFFTDCPATAADYAELSFVRDQGVSAPSVLVVEVELKLKKPFVWNKSVSLLFGEESYDRQYFAELRESLIKDGYDSIEVETGEAPTTVLLSS